MKLAEILTKWKNLKAIKLYKTIIDKKDNKEEAINIAKIELSKINETTSLTENEIEFLKQNGIRYWDTTKFTKQPKTFKYKRITKYNELGNLEKDYYEKEEIDLQAFINSNYHTSLDYLIEKFNITNINDIPNFEKIKLTKNISLTENEINELKNSKIVNNENKIQKKINGTFFNEEIIETTKKEIKTELEEYIEKNKNNNTTITAQENRIKHGIVTDTTNQNITNQNKGEKNNE